MATTQGGTGYWFVASDGGIFSYNAPFWGSTGSIHLNKPVVGMATDTASNGYWFVASDGGIFSYNASFLGSTGSIVLSSAIVGMESNATGSGYRFVSAHCGVFDFGTSGFYGTPICAAPPAPPPVPPTPPPSAGPSCKASAYFANDGYQGDYYVNISSNQPYKEATATDATDSWSDETNGSGSVLILLYFTSPGELINVTVGGASCSTYA
jgi:hypothetical protein